MFDGLSFFHYEILYLTNSFHVTTFISDLERDREEHTTFNITRYPLIGQVECHCNREAMIILNKNTKVDYAPSVRN